MVVGRCQLPYAIFQGAFVGAMINIPLNNKLGLGRVSIQADDFFLNFMSQTCTSDTGGRASLPDYGVSLPISCTSFSVFRFILCY